MNGSTDTPGAGVQLTMRAPPISFSRVASKPISRLTDAPSPTLSDDATGRTASISALKVPQALAATCTLVAAV